MLEYESIKPSKDLLTAVLKDDTIFSVGDRGPLHLNMFYNEGEFERTISLCELDIKLDIWALRNKYRMESKPYLNAKDACVLVIHITRIDVLPVKVLQSVHGELGISTKIQAAEWILKDITDRLNEFSLVGGDAQEPFIQENIRTVPEPDEKFEYPLYRKLRGEKLVVKFKSLTEGEVVVAVSPLYSKGYTSRNWRPHTTEVIWERVYLKDIQQNKKAGEDPQQCKLETTTELTEESEYPYTGN